METIILGTCICCGYPSEIQVRKKGAIVVGCNKSAKQVNPTCSEYPCWCNVPSRCPLHQPEVKDEIDKLARAVFDLSEQEYHDDEPIAVYFETSNTSFLEAFETVLDEKRWSMSDGGAKKVFSKITCQPVESFPGG